MFSSLCSADLVSDMDSVLSDSFSGCDWFIVSCHKFDEKKQLDHESIIIFSFIDSIFIAIS